MNWLRARRLWPIFEHGHPGCRVRCVAGQKSPVVQALTRCLLALNWPCESPEHPLCAKKADVRGSDVMEEQAIGRLLRSTASDLASIADVGLHDSDFSFGPQPDSCTEQQDAFEHGRNFDMDRRSPADAPAAISGLVRRLPTAVATQKKLLSAQSPSRPP